MESTLALKYTDLTGEVGDFLGYGAGADNDDVAWDDRTERIINRHVMSGLRWVYFPDLTASGGVSYDWSFLHIWRQVTLLEGESAIILPDDFGGLEGPVLLSTPEGQNTAPVFMCNPAAIHQKYAEQTDYSGIPRMVALEAIKGTTHTEGSRSRLYVWPLADQDCTFEIGYYVLPAALNRPHPYPYGGATHAETFKAAVKAAAELDSDDKMGPQYANFIKRLATSISLDRRSKPQHFGYNGDRSDGQEYYREVRRNDLALVTFNGVEYD